MRMIDADALMEVLEKIPAVGFKNIDNQTYVLVLLAQIYNIIKQQPTIEERKKGERIGAGKQMIVNLENAREQYAVLGYPHRNELKLQCSCCRKITMVDETIAYNFCPHCGADMRGKTDE